MSTRRFVTRKERGKAVAGSSHQAAEEHEGSPVTRAYSPIAFTKEGLARIMAMGKRSFLYEVEFRPVNTAALPDFKERFEAEIERRGWQMLTARAPAVNHSIVREFYGNFPDARHPGDVFIRGKWVRYTEDAIADFYNLPYRGGDCIYGFGKRTAEQVEAVTRTIAFPGAQWNMGANGTRVTWISRGDLIDEARNWLRFIDNRLYPNSVSGEVTWYRATILYAIMAQKDLNAAAIIRHFLEGNKKNCGLPAMISEMARQARVPTKNSDDTFVPAEKLEPETFFHVIKKSKRKRLDGASGVGVANEEEEAAAFDQNPPSAAYNEIDDIRERLGRMEMHQQYMGMQMDALMEHFQVQVPSYEEYWTPSFPPPPED